MIAATQYKLKGKAKDSYLELVLAFPLTSIRDAKHLAAASEVVDALSAKSRLDAGELMYLEALGELIAAHEDEAYLMPPVSDAAMLRHLMEAKGVNQADIYRDAGISKSTISEILAGKRPFSRSIIRKLSAYFKVDVGILSANL